MKDTQNQGATPTDGKITMANWQQYKQFMPLGMQKLFQGGRKLTGLSDGGIFT